jgi:hypothetical protein
MQNPDVQHSLFTHDDTNLVHRSRSLVAVESDPLDRKDRVPNDRELPMMGR